MPELPEVETVKNSLKKLMLGRKIAKIKILRAKSFPFPERKTLILNQEITAFQRRAKYLDLVFANNYHLLTHLKMTGQLLYKAGASLAGGGHPTADVLQQLPGPHTRIIYTLDNGSHLYFNDLRVFGWMKVLTETELQQEYQKLGPDANTDDFTTTYLQEKIKNKKQPIKQVIMSNEVCCGLGNIYAAEVLFAAKIDPRRAAQALKTTELERIVFEAKRILQLAIEKRGTTFDGRYLDGLGAGGNFESFLQVYGREGQPCQHCGTKISSLKLGGRSTCFCPHCQI